MTAGAAPESSLVQVVQAAIDHLAQVTSSLSGGEARRSQVEMAAAVARALHTGRHLVVQAGTGTGKSLGYLVPAVLSGQKVVVATATKALQDQLVEKDLPQVAAVLPGQFSYTVLKGRSNYLCRQRAAELAGRSTPGLDGAETDPGTPQDPKDAEPKEAGPSEPSADDLGRQIQTLLAWMEETQSGDRAELAFEPDERAWAEVSVGPRECPGAANCREGHRCFAEAARARAAEADVVVVNTHLYGTHLATEGKVLPLHDVVVFDEAHEVEEVMTATLGVEITAGRFRRLAAQARPLLGMEHDPKVLDDLQAVGIQLQQELEPRLGTRAMAVEGEDQTLADLLTLAATRLQAVTSLLQDAPRQSSLLDSADWDAGARRGRVLSAAGQLAGDLARFAGRTLDELAWVDGTRRLPVLRLSPIDVGPPLAGMLWGEVTAVLTSATIPPRVVERLGLSDFPVEQCDVGSPFDYAAHGMLYVARHLPDRRRPEAEAAIHVELATLIEAAGGRTLALFTSRRATDAAVEALRDALPYRILVQGELPKSRLLQEFGADETSCLFATMGFWQGVDVPGRALSLVTLDRLPFPYPDPLLEARRAHAGEHAFALVDLPRAATLLAQGAGRLIRSTTDRGVVAVLDPRLATAPYRQVLLASVPPFRRSVDRAAVVRFLGEALAQ